MKPLPWLLAVSVAGNCALLFYCLRAKPPGSATPASPAAKIERAPARTGEADSLRAALASGDPAALAAAGVPAETIRAFTVGRAFDTFQARMRAMRPPQDAHYWRPAVVDARRAREQRLAASNAERDMSEAVRVAYGEDLATLFGDGNSGLSVLPPEKRERLRQIERDYTEMEQVIYAEQHTGIQLPSDREKLKLLYAEKERDLAAVLTPAERELIALRDSSTANTVSSRFGEVLKNEEDYKRVFALQKAFDDQFNQIQGPRTAEQMTVQREAERKLMNDIRAVLGPEQWAAAERTNDQDMRTLTSVARRLNLDANATTTVLALREAYAGQSMQINANAALSPRERQTQIQALAAKAQVELTAKLGPEGGPAFVQQAAWIGFLRDGRAFSLDPKDSTEQGFSLGPRTYPVAPPKVPPRPDN
jgi:hypothetical protein